MTFVFDENFPKEFVHGFSILEKANKRSNINAEVLFSPEVDGLGYQADDEDIIKMFSTKNAVIVTHDKDFRRIKHYKPLLIEHEVGYVIFRVPKGVYQYWDIVKAFINRWEDLKEQIMDSSCPFAFEVNKLGQLNKLSF